MKVKQIAATRLFDTFDHTIPLRNEDRITIIHGPNGYGKTVMLQMLDSLFNSGLTIFRRIPFRTFQVEFDNGTSVRVRRDVSTNKKKQKIALTGPDGENFDLAPIDRENFSLPLSIIQEVVPELARYSSNEWINRYTNQILSIEDIIENYGHLFPGGSARKLPPWLQKIREELQVRLVRTDRLLTRPITTNPRYRPDRPIESTLSVMEYSKELATTIQEILAQSVVLTSSLDRSFPARVMEHLSSGHKPELTQEELSREFELLEKKRFRLQTAGLLDKDDVNVRIPVQTADPQILNLLSIYANDVEEKLRTFDTILEKIELFQEIVNRRFSYKRISIDKQRGFVLTSTGNILSPESLSSGEQHEIVLLYELLFKVKPNSLILIDEPEISLHIAWQRDFLNDINAIIDLSKFDVLIATHSPDIINNRWDLTIELKGPEH